MGFRFRKRIRLAKGNVDQAECLRYGIDAPSSTEKIELDPKSLTEEQRNFVADQIYDGLRFPADGVLISVLLALKGSLLA